MTLDTTAGKIATNNGGWLQVTPGAVISFEVAQGAHVKVVNHKDYPAAKVEIIENVCYITVEETTYINEIEVEYYFDFTVNTTANVATCEKKFEGTKGTWKGIEIDATNGKWANNGSGWIQVNAGTVITLNVGKCYKVDLTVYTSIENFQINTATEGKCIITVLNDDYIKQITTTYGQHTVSTEWTKDETGHWTVCTGCGEVIGEVLEHTYSADCDVNCNDCSFVREVETDHTWDNACDATCNLCGATRTPEEHKYENEQYVKTAEGHALKCDVCALPQEVVAHTPDHEEATEEYGITCTVCGYIIAPQLNHEHKWEETFTVDTAPTCTEAGSKSIHCQTCNETKDVTVIEALTHAYGTASYTWTPDNTKVTATVVCSRDGSHVVSEEVETTVKVNNNCLGKGSKVYTATFASELFETQTKSIEIDQVGHAINPETKVQAKAAECLVDGNVEYYTCLTCDAHLNAENEILEETVVPATGHTLVAAADKTTCSVCSKAFTNYYLRGSSIGWSNPSEAKYLLVIDSKTEKGTILIDLFKGDELKIALSNGWDLSYGYYSDEVKADKTTQFEANQNGDNLKCKVAGIYQITVTYKADGTLQQFDVTLTEHQHTKAENATPKVDGDNHYYDCNSCANGKYG